MALKLSFTGVYWVLLGFTRLFPSFIGCYSVWLTLQGFLRGWSEFHWGLLGFTGFHFLFIGFDWVLLVFKNGKVVFLVGSWVSYLENHSRFVQSFCTRFEWETRNEASFFVNKFLLFFCRRSVWVVFQPCRLEQHSAEPCCFERPSSSKSCRLGKHSRLGREFLFRTAFSIGSATVASWPAQLVSVCFISKKNKKSWLCRLRLP